MSGSAPETDKAGETLRRIADLLGVPVGTFHEAAERRDETGTDPVSAEARRAELITLYDALRDRQSRQFCIDFVRVLLELERNAAG